MSPMTDPPLSFPGASVPEEQAITPIDPACEEEEVVAPTRLPRRSPEGQSTIAAPEDEGAENLPCQVDPRTSRPKSVLLNVGINVCE